MGEGYGSGVLWLLNGQGIVDALFSAHPTRMPRAGIARATGLSKPTVSALIADMESAGLVRISDESPSSGSIDRPAALYELVPTVRHSVMADIGATKNLVGVADLFGNLAAEQELPTGPDARAALESVTTAASEMLRGIDGGRHAMCVGAPGIYRPGRDRVEPALNLPGFDNLALGAYLSERFDARVHVENDVNLAALGELTRMGEEQADGDFAAVSVGTGIGLGMVVGGDLYRGGTGSAGELGSLLLSPPEPGEAPVTLEDLACAPSIRKRFGRAIEDGHGSGGGQSYYGTACQLRRARPRRGDVSTGRQAGGDGRRLGRHRSTVYRELGRGGYDAETAQAASDACAARPKTPKLAADSELAAVVADGLRDRWSPHAVSAQLRCDGLRMCAETIYAACYDHTGSRACPRAPGGGCRAAGDAANRTAGAHESPARWAMSSRTASTPCPASSTNGTQPTASTLPSVATTARTCRG